MSEENKDNITNDGDYTDGSEAGANSDIGQTPDVTASALFGTDGDMPAERVKKPRRVSLPAFVCTCIALVLAAVMVTYTVCSGVYQKKLADARLDNISYGASGEYDELELLKALFEAYSFEELDDETVKNVIMKAFVAATGDKYAEYYTDEEYEALTAEMEGESQGIGINIINSSVTVNSVEYKALKVINVIKGSPAEKSGMLFGDFIIAVGSMEENDYTTLSELGYDMGLKRLQGEKGTTAEFVVYRETAEEPFIDFSILRDEFTTTSVMFKTVDASLSAKTGIVKILNFDRTTPSQLENAIDTLRDGGCEKFVFDVRYNPGGELSSIVACLSFFLDEGDTIISMKDKAGNETLYTAQPVSGTSGCNVAAEDIGKYRELDMVVLCNESTASAAELFVANFRDHGLGEIIGTTTYGKGSVQTYIDLSYFGCDGVLKMTRYMYYPPNGEGYDGVGIEPTETVELSEEAAKQSIYDIMGTAADNQLAAAVKHFNNN